MRRLQAYVAGSVTLATTVLVYAALERPNFYSACVYLAQSNACLMVLCNFALVLAGTIMYTLQTLLFGPLRPLETEQLWERGWFAMMEWVFAMSTFRDEFGVWFLVMFTSLFLGKIWGWIAEGRVEHLEQQAPNNNTLLHGRLLTSLAVYVAFAAWMFNYCLDVVVLEARPGMTIMFVFEFAILCISAVTACARYALWAQEHRITRQQVTTAVETRKAEIRKERKEAEDRIKANPEAEDAPNMADLPREEDVDENEIEAPGWEAKKGWLFTLDIVSDLLKLVAYMAFFTILTVFYGIPIYIIRDLYMTTRSFTKRVSDYLRFQAATRDMDTRYPNATAQDLAQDNTCIVCREEMRPVEGEGAAGPVGQAMHQKQKPKKLPCGHILHFGCLSSWLERQQACPICRRSVFAMGQPGAAGALAAGQPLPGGGVPGVPGQIVRGGAQPGQQNVGRVFRFGPLQVQLGGRMPGRHNDQDLLNALGRLARNHRQAQQQARGHVVNGVPVQPTAVANGAPNAPGVQIDLATPSVNDPASSDIHPGIRSAAARMALNTIEQQIQWEIQALNIEGQRANTLRSLLNELDRARNVPVPPPRQQAPRGSITPGALPPTFLAAPHGMPPFFGGAGPSTLQHNQSTFPFARASETSSTAPPTGVVVPQGWTLTPLNPLPQPSADSQPQVPQLLQDLIEQNMLHLHPHTNGGLSSSRSPSAQQLNNPLAALLQNSYQNGQGYAPGASAHVSPHAQATTNGPFSPPSHQPVVTVTNRSSTHGTPTTLKPNDIMPTGSSSSTAPTSATTTSVEPNTDAPPPPTNVTQSWSFPAATTSGANGLPSRVPDESADKGKGKAPAVDVESQTSMEQNRGSESSSAHQNSNENRQPSVEDVEGDEGA